MPPLFDVLLAPLAAFFTSNSPNIDKQSDSRKLFFEGFCKNIFFAIINQVDSLRSLAIELKTNDSCTKLGLSPTPFSTMKDAFSRFHAKYFRQLYESALGSLDFAKMKAYAEMGILCIVDGSLFPMLIQMEWAEYKSTQAACKLHLCFELNRMIATNFLVGSGNSSERDFLLGIAENSVTYIVDRGYFSFELVKKLTEKQAFFLMRIKSNILFEVKGTLDITHTVAMPLCFFDIHDQIIHFSNDKNTNEYRLVRFSVAGKVFHICTNRLDLNTLQIIMLYSLRWQIELMFKFLKCSLKCIHLFNHSKNGVQAQFYLWLCVAVLMLKLKQTSQSMKEEESNEQTINEQAIDKKGTNEQANLERLISYFGYCPAKFVNDISKILYTSWKISKNFLILLKNSITKIPDYELFTKFSDI